MKHYARLFLALSVLMASVLAQGKPQDKVDISTNPPPPAMSFPVIKEVGSAKAMYNERTGRTIAQTALLQVTGDWSNGIKLRVGFESVGKTVAKPSTVKLTFHSSATDRIYADNRAISISLDDKNILSDVARFENGNTNGRVFLITVAQEIPYGLFLNILAGKKIRIKIGPTEFDLKASDLESLKDLKKLIDKSE